MNKRALKITIYSVTAICFIGVLISIFFLHATTEIEKSSKEFFESCKETLGSEVQSPSKTQSAIIFAFTCKTGAPLTYVSILTRDEKDKITSENIFVSHSGSRIGKWGGPYVETSWVSAQELLIKYTSDSTSMTKKELSTTGIKITYEAL